MWHLAYFEDARNSFLAEQGVGLRELQSLGYDLQVVHYEVDWSGPVGWRDDFRVVVETETVGRTSFALRYVGVVGNRTVVEGLAVYVVSSLADNRPTSVPSVLREILL